MHAHAFRLVCAPTTCRKLKPTPPPPPPPLQFLTSHLSPHALHTRPHPRGCRNGCMHPPPHPSTPKWVCVWASCTYICMCCTIPPIHPTQPHHAPWRRGRAAPTHPHMRACMHAPHTTPHIQTHKGGCNLVQGCCCWAMHAYIQLGLPPPRLVCTHSSPPPWPWTGPATHMPTPPCATLYKAIGFY